MAEITIYVDGVKRINISSPIQADFLDDKDMIDCLNMIIFFLSNPDQLYEFKD